MVNIEDSSECFGTYQFPEHVDLVNCGHASISFNISGSNQTFKSCFYIPDNHFTEEFQKYFKVVVIDSFVLKFLEAYSSSTVLDDEEIDSQDFFNSIKSASIQNNKRKLQSG